MEILLLSILTKRSFQELEILIFSILIKTSFQEHFDNKFQWVNKWLLNFCV